jgi:hypothetical protein
MSGECPLSKDFFANFYWNFLDVKGLFLTYKLLIEKIVRKRTIIPSPSPCKNKIITQMTEIEKNSKMRRKHHIYLKNNKKSSLIYCKNTLEWLQRII